MGTWEGQRQLTQQELDFVQKGEARAINKFGIFDPGFLFIEDDEHREMLSKIIDVIGSHPKVETYNPRFLEVYVELVLFCQMVRRYNRDELLSDDQLNGVLDWLSEIVNSFVHF
jgi:hypothetical protein